MEKDITLVSAFFDIHRGEWGDFSRSADEYTRHFAFWAGMKNTLLIYTDAAMAKRIHDIREEKGLADRTKVIVIDRIEDVVPEILKKMKKTMQLLNFSAMRIKPESPESTDPQYNYLMFLKGWFLQDAVKNQGVNTPFLAWIDYGFNHGGDYYPQIEQLQFEWKTDLDSAKLHFFTLRPIPEVPIYQMVCKMSTYIQGCSFLVPLNKVEWLYEKMCEAFDALYRCGIVDDDQILYVMISREYPEVCDLHICGWGECLKLFSSQQLHYVNVQDVSQGRYGKFLDWCRRRKIKRNMISRIKKILEPLDW